MYNTQGNIVYDKSESLIFHSSSRTSVDALYPGYNLKAIAVIELELALDN